MSKDGLKYLLKDRYLHFKKLARTSRIKKRLHVTVGEDQSSSSVSSDALSDSVFNSSPDNQIVSALEFTDRNPNDQDNLEQTNLD